MNRVLSAGAVSTALRLGASIVATPHLSCAQSDIDVVAERLRAHAMEVRLDGTRLLGAGSVWLSTEASKAQFLFIGEEHEIREIPLVLRALWPNLAAAGYRHLAIEAGPWLANRLSAGAWNDDTAAYAQFVDAVLPRRPNNTVPPASVEDTAFLGTVARTIGADPHLWGLDPEYRLSALLRRLAVIARDSAVRLKAAQLAVDREQVELRRASPSESLASRIATLARTAAPGAPGDRGADREMAVLTNALIDGIQGRAPSKRERFLDEYRAAQAAGELFPRVVLRFGAYHAARGLMSDFRTTTLANFVNELAFVEAHEPPARRDANSSTSTDALLNIGFVACTTDSPAPSPSERVDARRPCSPRERRWLPTFTAAAPYAMTLFDLRAVREDLRGRLYDYAATVPSELLDEIAAFDGVILLRTATRSTLLR